MSKPMALLGMALIASLAANVYLYLGRSDASTPPDAVARSSRAATLPAIPIPVRTATPAKRPTTPSAIPSSYAKLDRAVLEQRLANAEARIHALLPPNERFDLDEPAPEHETELQPFLDKIFAVKNPADRPYVIECRGVTCRLSAPNMGEWMGPLQQDAEGLGRFDGMMFGGDEAYLVLAEPETDPNKLLLFEIAKHVQGAPALAECRKSNPQADKQLFAIVKLDSVSRRLVVEMRGDQATDPIGECARRTVEELIAPIAIGPAVTKLELPVPIVVPNATPSP